MPDRSYLICSVPRSGSGLLAKLLRGTGIAGRPEEYFWRGDEPMWRERWGTTTARNYVAAALVEGSTPNGVFGARVMWGYIDDVVAKLASITGDQIERRHEVLAAALPRLRYIHLTRLDHLAQAVSWAKAVQTNEWFAGDPRTSSSTPSYDRVLIERLLDEIPEGEHGWDRFFAEAGIEPLRLTYEALVRDAPASLQSTLAFLGLRSASLPADVDKRRQADSTNEEWIARYRAEVSGQG